MKTSELIKHLTDCLAREGDLEVYVTGAEPGMYAKSHPNLARAMPLYRARGKLSMFVDGAKAKAAGYDLTDKVPGLAIG